MYGYIFEVVNKQTGDRFIGKRYSVSFDKNYFGEEFDKALAQAVEKYGRPSFEARMIMPYEEPVVLDTVFEEMQKMQKKPTKKKEVETEEAPVEEKAPKKRTKKTVEEK